MKYAKKEATGTTGKFSVYEKVTNRIISELEKGVIPWEKPWSGGFDGAFNRFSGNTYSLINQCLLNHTGEYGSYKQWHDLACKMHPEKVAAKEWPGGVIKNPEKEFVVFWKITKKKEIDSKTGEEVEKTIPVLRYFEVFHISQVQIEGLEPLTKEERKSINPVEEAEDIITSYLDRSGVKMERVLSNEAYYSPMLDKIVVPRLDQFKQVEEAYSTYFHEAVHSTGHASRLDRFGKNPSDNMFGSESYSKEELTAEMGSAFILNFLSIETDRSFRNSSAYIQGWLKALKNDTRLITSAASKAEKAVKLILNLTDDGKEETEE